MSWMVYIEKFNLTCTSNARRVIGMSSSLWLSLLGKKNYRGNEYSDVDHSSNLFLSIKTRIVQFQSLQNTSVTNSHQIHERTKEMKMLASQINLARNKLNLLIKNKCIIRSYEKAWSRFPMKHQVHEIVL